MGPTHIPALRLKSEGVPFNHVPIDGAGKVAPALLGGQVDAAIVPSGGGSGSISKMKVLAVFAPERSTRYPDVPTMKELGYDINSVTGRYIAAPKGISAERRKLLEDHSRISCPGLKSLPGTKTQVPLSPGDPVTNCARCLKIMNRKDVPWFSIIRRCRKSSSTGEPEWLPLFIPFL